QGFQLDELAELCMCLRWDGSRFVWCEPELERFPLTLETPPENGKVIDLVRQVGLRSRDASRVEVPFSFIAPAADSIWTDDSRGDRFRDASVNDLAGYREACPGDHCPRVLLIVDEFQEFFVEDDKLSQEAALLLDRLVRQGRAFGLHILPGSQTLGGVYSLARS